MAKAINKIRFSQDNIQLLDIFHSNSYLELGNIEYDKMKKLLKKRVMNINEFVNFDIQNIGIGAHKVSDNELKTLLPYIFFENINLKDRSPQLFLTYGLLLYKNHEYKEAFAPLVLIPINLTISKTNVYIQVIGNPIENNILIKYLINRFNIKIFFSDKLNNIYYLDRFCMQFTRFPEMEVKVENYLTYASISYPQIVINHEKFSLKSNFIKSYGNKYLVDDNKIYNITKLNYKQRLALERARSGNSFAINGYPGTGKTTTLINIACDAFYRHKKVLYVANNRDTLNYVYQVFYEKGLDSLLVDLTKSFPRYYNDEYESVDFDDDFISKLRDNYEKIDEYEKLLSTRILNNRFLDVLRMKFLIEPPTEYIKIDDLHGIYKHEYEEIARSLEIIDAKMKKLDKAFKESKFKNIPINHHIKYPNQIITLLFQIHKLFSELSDSSKTLHKNYGFKQIPNYAKFRNVITDFNNLDIEKIPKSWTDFDNFILANNKYQELKNLIYTIQEYELYLDWDYQNLDTININEEIKNIIHPYFSNNDINKINYILENHHQIINKLQTYKGFFENYFKVQKKVISFFEWNFIEDDDAIKEIIRLTNYLNENFVYKKWLNINNYQINRKKIISFQEKISKYYQLLNLYNKYFKNIDYINNNITRLSNYKKTGKIPKKYRDINLDELIADLKQLKSLSKNLEKLKSDYYEYTGKKYNVLYNILIDYDNFYNYLTSISNQDYRIYIINFLSTLDYNRFGYYLRYLNHFKIVHTQTNEIYEYLNQFLPKQNHHNHYQKVLYLFDAYQYFDKIRKINQKMVSVIKQNTGIIKIEEYFKLQKRITELEAKKHQLKTNTVYKKLYGQLFNYEKTNINEIGSVIKKFIAYSDCFQNQESLKKSLQDNVHQEIMAILNRVRDLVFEISETLKLYGRIFKDGVGNYYYEEFDEVTDYLSDLMKAKDELITYLEITDHLKIIGKYRLYILNDLIINNEVENVANLFNYHYFETVYNLFIEKYPEILKTKDIENCLLEIKDCEEKLIESHKQELRNRKYRITHNPVFEEYLKNAGKVITLTNTFILNLHLNIQEFDLILIDDAHLTNANEYYQAINGKQVIIAGEKMIPSSSSANLLSRIRPSNMMSLNYRYLPTPLKLLTVYNNLQGVFLPKVVDNGGYEIIVRDEIQYIASLFLEDENLKVTYFTPNFNERRKIFDGVAEILLKNNISKQKVMTILMDQFKIVDLFSGYGYDSDYNIINLKHYQDKIVEYMTIDDFANLILCKKKLIFIDENNILSEENPLTESLKPLLTNTQFFNPEIKDVLNKVRSKLNMFDIIVHGFFYNLSLVIEKNNVYYGILLLVNPDTAHLNILEDYREYLQAFIDNEIKVIPIWITDLVNDFETTINHIRKGIDI